MHQEPTALSRLASSVDNHLAELSSKVGFTSRCQSRQPLSEVWQIPLDERDEIALVLTLDVVSAILCLPPVPLGALQLMRASAPEAVLAAGGI